MRSNQLFFGGIFAICITAIGCTEQQVQQLKSKPSSIGDPEDILVVADSEIWNSTVGDSFTYFFASPYPVLPQPEPIFEVKHTLPSKFYKTLTEFRNIVMLGELTGESHTTDLMRSYLQKADEKELTKGSHLARDVWAKGQQVFFISDIDKQSLTSRVVKSFPTMKQKIKAFNKEQYAAKTFASGKNLAVSRTIQENMGITMEIPLVYKIAHQEENLIWLREEPKDYSSNIVLQLFDYDENTQLSVANFKRIKNDFGKRLVTSDVNDSYMKLNDVDLPVMQDQKNIGGHYGIRVRGIWELQGDFMGGPFVGYMLYNDEAKKVLFIDGFVHAPENAKLPLMEKLEHILEGIKF